jgi:hypothetical protein
MECGSLGFLVLWVEVRKAYPNQWLVIEAVEAHSAADHRLLDKIAVVEVCADGTAALQSYRKLHQTHPARGIGYPRASMAWHSEGVCACRSKITCLLRPLCWPTMASVWKFPDIAGICGFRKRLYRKAHAKSQRLSF